MIPLIEPDCTGRKNLREVQMPGIIAKLKKHGTLNQAAPSCEGRGIVIAGGGRYLVHAWAVCRHLRKLGWKEGIQVWHLGKTEMPDSARPRFVELDVQTIDALEMRRSRPMRILEGWHLKTYAVMNCPYRHVMFLDADAVVDVHPNELFNDRDIKRVGNFFMSDVAKHHPSSWAFVYGGVKPTKPEWETGFFITDKVAAWMAWRWSFWLHERSDVFFKLLHGDKGVIALAFLISGCPFIQNLDVKWEPEFGIGHYYKGRRICRHMMRSKRGEVTWPEDFSILLDQWMGGEKVPVPSMTRPLFVR